MDNTNGVLILLRGLPGSGKSTLANYLFSNNVFEADKYWYDKDGNYNFDITRLGDAHRWCQSQVEKVMQEPKESQYGHEIVVSNTSTTEKELDPYLKLAKKYNYKVISLIVENRHEGINIHNVPEDTLMKMRERFSVKL